MSNAKTGIFATPQLPKSHGLRILRDSPVSGLVEGRSPIFVYPPRTMGQLLRLIKNGHVDAISTMEWLQLLQDSFDWEFPDDESLADACGTIWQAICQHLHINQLAFFKAALAIDGKASNFAKPLLHTLPIVKELAQGISKLKAEWLLAVQANNFSQCLESAFQADRTPQSMIAYLGLPKANGYLDKLYGSASDFFKTKKGERVECWLLAVIEQVKTAEQQAKLISEFIAVNKLTTISSDRLITWLEKHCLPLAEASLWSKLSEVARQRLKGHFKISSYYALRELTRLLESEPIAHALSLDEKDCKQIRGRANFWANYSNNFEQMVVLLPAKTHDLLVEWKSILIADNVIRLPAAPEEDTEACVFELEEYLIVEFFRGAFSEIRIFAKTEWNVGKLLNNNSLTLSVIRKMAHDEVHDHVFLWQYFCERMLRQKLKILPNRGTERFIGLSRYMSAYSVSNGLTKPDDESLKKRESDLASWIEGFWAREFSTGKFETQSDLMKRSNIYVMKAKMAKELGDSQQYKTLITKAANQGNGEAMFLLGRMMLASGSGRESERKAGEAWIKQSAEAGYEEAMKVLGHYKRFGQKI
ncbi:SEL1-like repeat protein [Ferrimonas balearica]|uniref:SEL1-like repeat protein n=1 Tax=Ferrimonas balearica TaxID=44012 RepID=UPI002D805100|nr:EH signature domain-containing protein [Ferrimonas balearica]MBY6093964.1 hypothetical protein [Ferrimonas balearica]